MNFDDNKIQELEYLIAKLETRPTLSGTPLQEYFDGNSIQIKDAFNNLIESLNKNNEAISKNIDAKADATDVESSLATKADKTTVENALANKVDKQAGKGLSSNDYTTEEKEKLASLKSYDDTALKKEIKELEEEFSKKIADTVNFKGNIKENELPTENNRKGDLYKFIPILKNKAYTSAKVIKNEIGYYTINGVSNLLTTKEFEEYNQAYLSNTTTNFNLSVDFFTTDWKYITTVSNIEYSESPLSYNVENSWNSIPDKLESNVDYYIVRTDSQSPDTTLPIKEVSYKPSADYAIYNGESFDRLYTAETVNNKIAKVEEDYKAKIIQATGLKLIKKITLKEAVTDVNFTFDKPLSEFVVFFNGAFDTAINNKGMAMRSDSGAWYMFWRTFNLNTSPKCFYAHAKEIGERLWETHFLSSTITSTLQGTADSAQNEMLSISKRRENIFRYVENLNLFVIGRETNMSVGTEIEIWGREVE